MKMKAAELRNQTIAELRATLKATRHEDFKLRLTRAAGEVKSTHQGKALRRTIARILTLLAQKERLEEQKGNQS